MESIREKFMRYLRIWLVIGAIVVIAAGVTHWESLKAFFASSVDALFSGGLTVAFLIFGIYIMLGGRLR